MKRKFIIGALLFSAFAFGACSGSVEVEDNTDSTESTENNETNVQADTDEERDSESVEDALNGLVESIEDDANDLLHDAETTINEAMDEVKDDAENVLEDL